MTTRGVASPAPESKPDPGGLVDPLISAAVAEVDRSLLRWMLSLPPRDRLRACTRASRALDRFRRGPR